MGADIEQPTDAGDVAERMGARQGMDISPAPCTYLVAQFFFHDVTCLLQRTCSNIGGGFLLWCCRIVPPMRIQFHQQIL